MSQKTEMESLTSEYSMSAGDNGLSRAQLNESILAQDGASISNENKLREKMEKSSGIQPTKAKKT